MSISKGAIVLVTGATGAVGPRVVDALGTVLRFGAVYGARIKGNYQRLLQLKMPCG